MDKIKGEVEVGEGGGFGWGGVEGWGEKAHNCNWITIKHFFKNGQRIWTDTSPRKTVWNFLRKLKIELPFDPAIPLLGLHPKDPETPSQKNLCTPMFIAAQFTVATCWKQPKCPSANEWIRKLWYIYTMEYYAAERRKELLPFSTAWMDLESFMLSEISRWWGTNTI